MSELLPAGTVTVLLGDVERSTRLWETPAQQTAAAVALLDRTVSQLAAAYSGVRPVEQRVGDGFLVAFTRAADAVACALALQHAPLAPIRLRIGVHTGDLQLRDESSYSDPTVNHAARLRDLAHGGQTLLSRTTSDLVTDRLPGGAWLVDLGAYSLPDLPRTERVTQLCHPDLRIEFPPLHTPKADAAPSHPVQLTSFVGRGTELADLRRILTGSRLVTLTGAGGMGKTRLAVQVSAEMADEFRDGVWYVDLAPSTDPDLVPVVVARTLGLPDQPGRSTVDTVVRFLGDGHVLMVVDNCEHLLDATAALIVALLGSCPRLTLLATSREPIAVAGEVMWRVPSLPLVDEALELFTDRARLAQPYFVITDDNADVVADICRRLDGMPLAIELAAARVRALSLTEILEGLHDRFRLLTGGARAAVRRHQTLRASVDWSHALLTETERVLFRRLATFMGTFDLDAARAVATGDDVERDQVLDQLIQLIDKSLVMAEGSGGRTRYRLLETVRQYGLEKLDESSEADAVRVRHRDYYTAMAALLDTNARSGNQQRIEHVETEIDNLRAAFAWSCERSDIEMALALASSLQPLWVCRGRIREGLTWFNSVLEDQDRNLTELSPVVWARAMADKAMIEVWMGSLHPDDTMARAQQALLIARDVDEPGLLIRALAACGSCSAVDDVAAARPYFDEAAGLARALGDEWRLSQILNRQAAAAFIAGDPRTARATAEEGRDLANAIGNPFDSRQCRLWFGWALLMRGDLDDAVAQFGEVVAEADASADVSPTAIGLMSQAQALAFLGDIGAARDAAGAAISAAAEFGGLYEGNSFAVMTYAALADGDVAAAVEASQRAWPIISAHGDSGAMHCAVMAQAALAGGDVITARRLADEAVAATTGWHRMVALTARARVAIAQDRPGQAERDAHAALAGAGDLHAYLGTADTMECLACLADESNNHRKAVRIFAAAAALRQRTGEVRFKVYQANYQASVAALRTALGGRDFEAAWAEGADMSREVAIAYAQRRRGERKRPASGWESLTPTELNVVGLVGEGLSNSEIATRLFVSPRTVQTHLTHAYAKLGLASRVRLVQEVARHT